VGRETGEISPFLWSLFAFMFITVKLLQSVCHYIANSNLKIGYTVQYV